MKTKNLKLSLSQYLSLKNINQKDFLNGKSKSDLENISRLLDVHLDLKPLEIKTEVLKPAKVSLPPTKQEVKSIVEKIEKNEDLVVESGNQNVAENISKLLEFAKEVVEDEDNSDMTSKRRRR